MQIVDDPLAGYGIAHLNESRAFFGLEEFDALHVAIETQQVEQLVAVRLLWIQSVENDDASLAGTHRRVWLTMIKGGGKTLWKITTHPWQGPIAYG